MEPLSSIAVYRDGCVITQKISRGINDRTAFQPIAPMGPILVSDRNGLADSHYHQGYHAPSVGDHCSVDFASGDRVSGTIAKLAPLTLVGSSPNGYHESGWSMEITEYSALTIDLPDQELTSSLRHNASAEAQVQYVSRMCNWTPLTIIKIGTDGYYLQKLATIECSQPIQAELGVYDQYIRDSANTRYTSGGSYQLGPMQLEHQNNVAMSESRGAVTHEYVHDSNSNKTWDTVSIKLTAPLSGEAVVYDPSGKLVKLINNVDTTRLSLPVMEAPVTDLDCSTRVQTVLDGDRYRTTIDLKIKRTSELDWPVKSMTLKYTLPSGVTGVTSDCNATINDHTMLWELSLDSQTTEINERCSLTYKR